MPNYAEDVARGRRFAFGWNWRRFLQAVNDERIAESERSLTSMLGVSNLAGTTFLDIGSGSGLSSLAARKLGARVHSFDYDANSVDCTRALKERYLPDDRDWVIEEGSVLDRDYLESLGKFDLVYSWGVLHHTGDMWQAMENAVIPLARGGRLFVAIYNYHTIWTRWHKLHKRAYVALPRPFNWLLAAVMILFYLARGLLKDLLLLRNPLARYRQYSRSRGMSWWHDTLDRIGGYPFEAATPEQVFDFYQRRGFVLERLTTCGGGMCCNQFVFRKALDAWT